MDLIPMNKFTNNFKKFTSLINIANKIGLMFDLCGTPNVNVNALDLVL